MDISDIKYARSGDVNIAYQRIGKYVRVLEFDKRGMASSDRFEEAPTLAQRVDDIKAVMDAEGIERAHVLGLSALPDLRWQDDDPRWSETDVLDRHDGDVTGLAMNLAARVQQAALRARDSLASQK